MVEMSTLMKLSVFVRGELLKHMALTTLSGESMYNLTQVGSVYTIDYVCSDLLSWLKDIAQQAKPVTFIHKIGWYEKQGSNWLRLAPPYNM